MKIIMAHNFYQNPGGEANSFKAESELLEKNGHEVIRYTLHNDSISEMNKLTVSLKSIWNRNVYSDFKKLIKSEKPDLVHFQNIFPLISPSAYYAVNVFDIPIIQTLRNYRLHCPSSDFYRNGNVCELCKTTRFPFPSIKYKCYKNSYMGSATLTAMLGLHNTANTWNKKVTYYIALTGFARLKHIEGGLEPSKILLKPNFISEDFGVGQHEGNYALFVGRLSPEKGVKTLIEAWAELDLDFRIKIIGDGPLSSLVKNADSKDSRIEYLGYKPNEEVRKFMKDASILIFPSEWYEGMPRTILEAYSVGLPVIASYVGSMKSMINHGKNGFHFTSGDSLSLKIQIENYIKNHINADSLNKEARLEYENLYTPEKNYQIFMDIYSKAINAN